MFPPPPVLIASLITKSFREAKMLKIFLFITSTSFSPVYIYMAGKVTFHLSVQNLAVDQAQILVVLRISSLVTLQS